MMLEKIIVAVVVDRRSCYFVDGLATKFAADITLGLDLRDRVYIVTGGSSGLGHATARQLIDEGARVVISGLGQAEVTQAAKTLSESRAVGVAADNAAPTTGDDLVAAALHHFGRLDGTLVGVRSGNGFSHGCR
jgi:short-subunit dehydrogenase involved in D-alanine esterification of teichoic acids